MKRQAHLDRLKALGYSSIEDFQRNNNIKPSGRLCRITKKALRGFYAIPKVDAHRDGISG